MDVVLAALAGFGFTLMLVALWKGAGRAAEAFRTLGARIEKLERAPRTTGNAAIDDLSDRLAKLERRVAEIDLAVLDTAEKVAHRLADRERKRNRIAEEVGDVDDAPDDPGSLLARARAAYPLPGMPSQDPAQLSLVDGAH